MLDKHETPDDRGGEIRRGKCRCHLLNKGKGGNRPK